MQAFIDQFIFSISWKYRMARHACFWLFYFAVFRLMVVEGAERDIKMAAIMFLPVNCLFVYLVLYRLTPQLLMRFSYWTFFFWYFIYLLACLSLDFFWGEYFVYRIWHVAPYGPPNGFWSILATIFDPTQFTIVNIMAGLGVTVKMYKFWRAEVWMKWQMAREKTRTELTLLKTQLQPQFLYNSLIHLHSQVSQGLDSAPPLLLRLSAILSYVLYECRDKEVVPLEREIAICREYIALEKDRHSKWLDVSIDCFGSFAGKKMAPLLLLPLIESAFATNNDMGEGAWMAFEFSVVDDQLFIRIIQGQGHSLTDRPVRQEYPNKQAILDRLNRLYEGRYSLLQKESGDADMLTLTINLAPAISTNQPTNTTALFEYAVFDY